MDSELHEIVVTVNGTRYQRRAEARMLLSDFIRHELLLAGTHVGCEHGVCGACTILFDGLPTRSCLMLAAQANGHEIMTVEGLARPPRPSMRLLHARHSDDHDSVPGGTPLAERN
jgi:aerobic-type carbon monoxide dehydrogenase small subunit (CoxS/CutS family)